MNLVEICKETERIARETGLFIAAERKKFSQSNVIQKGERDLVSYVDVTAEKLIVEGLQQLLPEAGFITEEKTVKDSGASLRWIIDPLDGTTNFIHGIPLFAVSIALQQDDDLLIGVVYEVNLDECFSAYKGGGAFMNGKKISVTDTLLLRNALCATGFPYSSFPHVDRYFNTLRYLFQNSHGIRRLGSAAVDLAYVACGRIDAFFEYNLNAWDVAGGALIVQEAGGSVTDFSGGSNFVFGKELIASNKLVHAEFLASILHPPERLPS